MLRIIIIVLVCVVVAAATAVWTAPVWIHHPATKQVVIAFLEDSVNRNLSGSAAMISDYRTDFLSFADFDRISIRAASKPTVVIDRLSFLYNIFDLKSGVFPGILRYGTARVKFDATLKNGVISLSTNWIESEEINLKLLRKFFRNLFGNVSVRGKLRLKATVRFNKNTPTITGRLEIKEMNVDCREYNLKVEGLSGYIPFREDFNPATSLKTGQGELRAKNIYFHKLNFQDLRSVILYDNYGAYFPRITCTFLKASATGKGKIWYGGKNVGYKLHGVFYNVDLEGLKVLIDNPDYGITGYGNGSIVIEGAGSRISELFIKLGSLGDGGKIRAAALKRILDYLPGGDIRDRVGLVLKDKTVFIYRKGFFTFVKTKGRYQAALFLDGDHLLDFKFNIDEELIDDIIGY